MLEHSVSGIHHITGIAGDARANLAFYRDLLGLRLLKRTVNFDDPGTWHLYYGTGSGSPGSILTFFPWGNRAASGRRGAGQVTEISLGVPPESLDFWEARLASSGKKMGRTHDSVSIADPDGFPLKLVAQPGTKAWDPESPGVPAFAAIRGISSAQLCTGAVDRSRSFLQGTLGWSESAPGTEWLIAGGEIPPTDPGELGRSLSLIAGPAGDSGRMGVGTMHHIAFRAANDEHQAAIGRRVVSSGIGHTEVKDRCYFRSIYFREPGGILYEVATDPPGFTVDEARDSLGTELRLPPWLEGEREQIASVLPSLENAS